MAALAQKSDPATPVLQVRNLVKRFGSVEVLKSIGIDMAAGDFLVLVGPSDTFASFQLGGKSITARLRTACSWSQARWPTSRSIPMFFRSSTRRLGCGSTSARINCCEITAGVIFDRVRRGDPAGLRGTKCRQFLSIGGR